jgi:CheY-like chemotaxis protein
VGFCIGIVTVEHSCLDLGDVMARADALMYAAKRENKNATRARVLRGARAFVELAPDQAKVDERLRAPCARGVGVPFPRQARQAGPLGQITPVRAGRSGQGTEDSQLHQAPNCSGANRAPASKMASSTSTPRRTARIVLAEDDSSLRELLASALERDGYEVVQATTGNELTDQIRRIAAGGERIDLVISDVRMPKMSGLAVLKLLRDAEFNMPVILITAFSDVWTRREAGEFGAVLLDKPVQLRTLRDEVKKALSREAGSLALQGSPQC